MTSRNSGFDPAGRVDALRNQGQSLSRMGSFVMPEGVSEMDSIPQWLQGFLSWANLGGLAGFASLSWNIFNEFWRRPRLKICEVSKPIRDDDHFFFCVEVRNTGRRPALGCRGTAKSEPLFDGGKSRKVHDLHWAYYGVGEDKFDEDIIIGKRNQRTLDVVFSSSQGTSTYLATNRDKKGDYQESSELAPGKHHIKIEVTCDNGKTASFSKDLLVPLKL